MTTKYRSSRARLLAAMATMMPLLAAAESFRLTAGGPQSASLPSRLGWRVQLTRSVMMRRTTLGLICYASLLAAQQLYTGTSVMFFASLNAIKLIPYGLLGQLSVTNLSVSAILLPLAPIGVFLGVWINRRLREDMFFAIILTAIFIVGLKLVWDGVFNLLGA